MDHFPKCLIDDSPALAQTMAPKVWRAIIWATEAYLTDAYMRHLAPVSWWYLLAKFKGF